MYLCMLLAVPVILGLLSLAFSKGKVTLKEFFVMEGAVALVLTAGYFIARYQSTMDHEVWNGRISGKEQVQVSCSHSYPCNCRSVSCGKNCSTTVCDTCYMHPYDFNWDLYTTSRETITIDRIDLQGVSEPPRWSRAYVGEPITTAHTYTNYILANPDSILRRTGAEDRFKKWIPPYPRDIYDYYRCNRFVSVGYTEPGMGFWNYLLNEINGDLGPTKQVNVIVVAVKNPDPAYEYALAEAWVGGKKNDVIVLLGVPEYPKISWARIVSWTTSADLKVDLRDEILQIGTMDRRDDIAAAIRQNVQAKFVRRHMKDFQYLMAGMQPGTTGTIVLFIIGTGTCIGLLWFFYNEDPFGDEWQARRNPYGRLTDEGRAQALYAKIREFHSWSRDSRPSRLPGSSDMPAPGMQRREYFRLYQ